MTDVDSVRKVTVMQDVLLEYPELWMSVYVTGNDYEQKQFAEMFVRARCNKATSPHTADLVVFAGGPDVNPALYGELPHYTTRFDQTRDEADMRLYEICLKEGIPMFGVCRGAQFLHVMNGGKLYQDVDKHNSEHHMLDVRASRAIGKVSSVHHQMCIRNDKMDILGTCLKSTTRSLNPTEKDTTTAHADIEAYFYGDTLCLGVQGHPEYRGYGEYTKWCLDQISDYIIMNPDVEWRDKTRRLKQSIIDERELLNAMKNKELA